jgi:hypothetical protein
LELVELEIYIFIDESGLPMLASGKGKFWSLTATRGLKVTRSFDVKLGIITQDFGKKVKKKNTNIAINWEKGTCHQFEDC